MLRRELLGGTAALAALALAGCSDEGSSRTDGSRPPDPPEGTTSVRGRTFTTTTPTPDPAPNLVVDGFRPDESDDGQFVVVVDVRNVGGQEASAVLVVTVTVGGETYDRERRVTLEGDATGTYEFEYPVTPTAFQNDGSLDFTWREGEG